MNIRELAKVIRTKNAGPYIYTADILFEDYEVYKGVKESGIINKELVAKLYNVPLKDLVTDVIFFDPGKSIKINIRRPVVSGDIGDTDILGMQQHAPLLNIEIPYWQIAKYLKGERYGESEG